jgi:NADPH2 dehydrogenase
MAESRLWKPVSFGPVTAKHRVGMPALTRLRAEDGHIPGALMKEYYSQRSAVPGTFIVTESSLISSTYDGLALHAPHMITDQQTAGWKAVVDEIHAKGCFVFCQLCAVGRVTDPDVAKHEGLTIVGPSAIPWSRDAPTPRTMTKEEIKEVIRNFVTSAKNAIKAGFDGIEFHGANGYLIDQFIQDVSNQRDDEYGGSVENRSRFIVELIEAVGNAIGFNRVALRLSPWSTFQGMRMKDTKRQFSDVIRKANQLGIAYLHLIESRVVGTDDVEASETLDFALNLWIGTVLIGGGFTPDLARKLIDEEYPDKDIVVMFGRHFVANPDLVFRIREGVELNPYKRVNFYTGGTVGYIDYPLSKEYLAYAGI